MTISPPLHVLATATELEPHRHPFRAPFVQHLRTMLIALADLFGDDELAAPWKGCRQRPSRHEPETAEARCRVGPAPEQGT